MKNIDFDPSYGAYQIIDNKSSSSGLPPLSQICITLL